MGAPRPQAAAPNLSGLQISVLGSTSTNRHQISKQIGSERIVWAVKCKMHALDCSLNVPICGTNGKRERGRMVRSAGFEPATVTLRRTRSIRLSYERVGLLA